MYDTFGSSGDQLKIFSVPIYYYNDTEYKKYKVSGKEYRFLGFMRGNLRNYSVGSKVPWRDNSYNYSPDFTVVDVGISDWPTLLFGFSNGKLSTIIEYDSEFPKNCSYLFEGARKIIDGTGNELDIRYDLLHYYIKAYQAEIKNRFRIINKFSLISGFMLKYQYPNTTDSHDDFNKAYDALRELEDESIEHNAKYLKSFYKVPDPMINDFEDYGGYLELVDRYQDEEKRPLLYDKNDTYSALMHESKRFVVENDLSLEEYFKWNQTPEEDKKRFVEIDKIIRDWGD